MTHSQALGTLVASLLTAEGYVAYDARSLTLMEFLEQQAVALTTPGAFASGGRWETDRASVTDAGNPTEMYHGVTVYLARQTGDVDADMHTLIAALHDGDGSNRYTARDSEWIATIIEAENLEGEYGFPVIEILLEINAG